MNTTAQGQNSRKITNPNGEPITLIAVSGLPGAGVATVARTLSGRLEAMEMNMGSLAWQELDQEFGVNRHCRGSQRKYLDRRLEKAQGDRAYWVRAFHRRLQAVAKMGHQTHIVITGVLTPYEALYCKMIGAKLIHVTAPQEVRKRRLGLRWLSPPHPAQLILDHYATHHPDQWDLIIDSDEPYSDFIWGIQTAMKGMLGQPAKTAAAQATPVKGGMVQTIRPETTAQSAV